MYNHIYFPQPQDTGLNLSKVILSKLEAGNKLLALETGGDIEFFSLLRKARGTTLLLAQASL